VLARGIPQRSLQGLMLELPRDADGAPLARFPAVFLEDIGEASPLASLRPSMEGAGLHALIAGSVGGEPVGILGFGAQSAPRVRAEGEVDVARCLILAYHTVRRRSGRDRAALHRMADLLAGWIDSREEEDGRLAGHSARVAALCRRLGKRMGMGSADLEALAVAASIHRSGSCPADPRPSSPAASRNAPPAEGREHTLFRILEHRSEEWNGGGAPEGLAGASVPLGSRILAVADAYDAHAAVRGRNAQEVARVLRDGAGVHWDPYLVSVLLDELSLGDHGDGARPPVTDGGDHAQNSSKSSSDID
jgi:HD-GYP domain-containing protein (c-di-GMP phosphodiesterase class II)